MARYIAWTQTKGPAYVREKARELFETLAGDPEIERIVADSKARVVQNITLNLLGLVLWAEFAGESGVLDEPTAKRMVQEHYGFLKTIFHEHVAVVSEERPFMLFLQHVRSMLDSGVAHVLAVRPKLAGGFEIGTRRVKILVQTAHPNGEWVAQMARNIRMWWEEHGVKPSYIIRDRDTRFTSRFDGILESIGARLKPISRGSPDLNPYAEARVGTFRRECLGKLIAFGESHLDHICRVYEAWYNVHRPIAASTMRQ